MTASQSQSLPLPLERPLVVLDIESTGLNPRTDRIVELALLKLYPDGASEEHLFRFHPEVPIPPACTAIHHISDADVVNCPPFRQEAERIAKILAGSDLAGFGAAKFDIPMLSEEFNRAGCAFDEQAHRIVDAQRIFHLKEPRNLTAALAYYCSDTHREAHSAMGDVKATWRVLCAQLQRYPDLPATVAELDTICNPLRSPDWADRTGKFRWSNGELLVNFGAQYKDRRLAELVVQQPGFLKWILKSDFPADTKRLVAEALAGRLPSPPAAS